jgi:hypothetical protein
MLRRKFGMAITARFNILKRELQELLIKGDAFGLGSPKPSVIFNWSDEARRKSLETRRRNAMMRGPKQRRATKQSFVKSAVKKYGKVLATSKQGGYTLRIHDSPQEAMIGGFRGKSSKKEAVQRRQGTMTIEAPDGRIVMSSYWLDIPEKHYPKDYYRLPKNKRAQLEADEQLKWGLKKGFMIGAYHSGRKPPFVTNSEEWRFLSEQRKVEELKKWLMYKTGQLFLKHEQQDSAQTWLGAYINQAYSRGMSRSFNSWKKPTGVMLMPKEAGKSYMQGAAAEFMRQSFGGPVPVERVSSLAARTFNDLQGITEQMSHSVIRTLLDGMVNGLNPRDIGIELNKVVDGYKNRGTAIARTEIVRAFNEGALDGYEKLGVPAIGVMVEWTTSGLGHTALGNPSPCHKCAPLAGLVLTVEEARGLLPRHVNCLCSYIPANVGEKTTGQIRDANRIRAAIAASARGDRRWVGAKKKISSKRPAMT